MTTMTTDFPNAFAAATESLTHQAMTGLITAAIAAVLLLSIAWAMAGIIRPTR